jgi:hypothetical protein
MKLGSGPPCASSGIAADAVPADVTIGAAEARVAVKPSFLIAAGLAELP